jgi:hypothetical protein
MGNAFGTKHDTSLSLAFISELKVTNRLINLHHKTHMGLGRSSGGQVEEQYQTDEENL